ncbi:TIGR00159 family protein [Candidatus Peregrinibacteria bacterium]|nr:TIGR00159 family protein [Candidatus Peregrinibacteria bacterium]
MIDFLSGQAIHAWQTVSYLDMSMYQIVVDILVVSVLFYWLVQWVRGTKAKQILTGLGLLGLLYVISRAFNLIALEWLLQNFFTVVLIAIPIIFQHEIRRGLQKLGETRFFTLPNHPTKDAIKEIVKAAYEIAEDKNGALIVIKKNGNLEEYEETGIEIDSKVASPLIASIFEPRTPLHDGAIIIHGNKIRYAACTLPQSTRKFDRKFGTRHKAALTLSEMTDAIIIVVSEERKSVSLCEGGEIYEDLKSTALKSLLKEKL